MIDRGGFDRIDANLQKEVYLTQKSSNGRHLEEIKDKRNRLAHGEQTFHDIGKNVTYGELRDRKQNIFDYLEDVIKKIEIFIESKNYKEKQ